MTDADVRRSILAEARNDLLSYTQICDPRYIVAPVHEVLARSLADVESGKCKRLIVSIPPRHGKSNFVAINWASYLMARRPGIEVVLASYSAKLAVEPSRKGRDRVNTAEFQSIFPEIGIDPDVSAAAQWRMTNGSSLQAVGIGGSLVGRGADCLIIDDPFKDFQEAHSESQRDKVWEWFQAVAYTRLSPNGVVVVIMTRWHKDDLVGRLLNPERQAELVEAGFSDEIWKEICLPALARASGDPLGRKPGEALFPQKFPAKRLRAIKATMHAYIWSALYDGNPILKGGNYISRASFRVVGPAEVPQKTEMRFWDLAIKEKASSDFTAGVKGCLGDDGTLFITDVDWKKTAWPQTKSRIQKTAEAERILVGVESNAAFDIAFQELRLVVDEGVVMQKFVMTVDKLTRALPWMGLSNPETGNRKLAVLKAPWNEAFFTELEEFPKGDHDDQVDGVSGLYLMLKNPRRIMLA